MLVDGLKAERSEESSAFELLRENAPDRLSGTSRLVSHGSMSVSI